ncbi:MAG: hypothetical protein ACE5ER_08555 [Nitrospinaceae bacterium]
MRRLSAFIAVWFLGLAVVEVAQGDYTIDLRGVLYTAPIPVISGAQVRLHNNWPIPVHDTTITQMATENRIARIETFAADQTLSLEFQQEGAYSICYFLAPNQPLQNEHCLFLKVAPLWTAQGTGPQTLSIHARS